MPCRTEVCFMCVFLFPKWGTFYLGFHLPALTTLKMITIDATFYQKMLILAFNKGSRHLHISKWFLNYSKFIKQWKSLFVQFETLRFRRLVKLQNFIGFCFYFSIFYEFCLNFYGLIRVVKTFSEAQKCRYGVNSRQRRIFCTPQGTAPSRVLPLQQKQHHQQSHLSKTLFCGKSGPKYVRYRILYIVCLSMVNLSRVFSHKIGVTNSSLPHRTCKHFEAKNEPDSESKVFVT